LNEGRCSLYLVANCLPGCPIYCMLQSGQVSLYIPLRWNFEDVVGCGGLEKCLDMELLVLKAKPSLSFLKMLVMR
jgi:hypothetical protein